MKRILVLGLVLSLYIIVVNAGELSADLPEVPEAGDLTQLASQSDNKKLPIMLMYFAEDCEYCERLEADIIKPMMLSGDFKNKALLRKIMIDKVDALTNFSGESTDTSEFADKRGIEMTPTLQFVDATGQELVPKVIGYQGADFFGAYLDDAIGGSINKLRQQ